MPRSRRGKASHSRAFLKKPADARDDGAPNAPFFPPSFFLLDGGASVDKSLGFNVETMEYKNISFTIWDGGRNKV
ncbi:ARF [Musa troglodytarum]|uniref:ARF n=1 Tax=Musa troglodytarum TaxID=320322 RepID=A0A9E7GPJ2_9LILI|nr:ARF [Musa troglodytarum]